jgi:predicted nucleic acid-binding protein
MKIFVDSDVIISSLRSDAGAAYLLLHTDAITPLISSFSKQEILSVLERLHMDIAPFEQLVEKRVQIVGLQTTEKTIQKNFKEYVIDRHDAHIVAGAKEGNVRFLITYNLKDFKIEKIKDAFGILILTPGQFLQYVRSRQ